MAKITTEHRLVKMANAKKPQPPAEYKSKWGKRELAIFDDYLLGRALIDWHKPQIRLLCQVVDAEVAIQDAHARMATQGGPVAIGGQGQPIAHPAANIITKMSNMQNSLLRRLGIANDGTTAPRDVMKNAKKSAAINAHLSKDGDADYKASLLAN